MHCSIMEKINFTIREIKRQDLREVFQMLSCLVKYEKLEEKFKLSEKKMANYLFGKNHDWFCLVVQDLMDNCLKGFVLYTFSNINRAFHLSPLLQIDHLYIKPSYRNYGLGESLINELKNRAKIKGANRLEVWCLASNEIGNRFYKKTQAEKLDFINIYRIKNE